MKKVMLIGPVACGKSTLCQVLNDLCIHYRKTQTIEFVQNLIDTPGEYLENHNLNRALAVTSTGANAVLLLQDCTDSRTLYPPAFSSLFYNRLVIGIVSKIDAAKDERQLHLAEEKLKIAGVNHIFRISSIRGDNLEELRRFLTTPV